VCHLGIGKRHPSDHRCTPFLEPRLHSPHESLLYFQSSDLPTPRKWTFSL
jgi:hypothetical protein